MGEYWKYALFAELFKRRGDQSKAKKNLDKIINIFKDCGAKTFDLQHLFTSTELSDPQPISDGSTAYTLFDGCFYVCILKQNPRKKAGAILIIYT